MRGLASIALSVLLAIVLPPVLHCSFGADPLYTDAVSYPAGLRIGVGAKPPGGYPVESSAVGDDSRIKCSEAATQTAESCSGDNVDEKRQRATAALEEARLRAIQETQQVKAATKAAKQKLVAEKARAQDVAAAAAKARREFVGSHPRWTATAIEDEVRLNDDAELIEAMAERHTHTRVDVSSDAAKNTVKSKLGRVSM